MTNKPIKSNDPVLLSLSEQQLNVITMALDCWIRVHQPEQGPEEPIGLSRILTMAIDLKDQIEGELK